MQMRFHPAKCRTIHLGKHNPNTKYTLPIDDETLHEIAQTAEEKDLGGTIDDKLIFSRHIQIQVNKANSAVGLIRHTFKHLDKESFLYLYKSLVRPHLEYASVIWSPKMKKHQDSIEKVQRRATRMLPEISHLSYTDRLLTLGLPSLKYRRERTYVIQLFKITHGFDTVSISSTCPICNNPMFKPSLATQTRGHPYKFQVQHTSGPRRNFFSTRVLDNWNKLITETVTSTTVNMFKSRLTKEWHNKPDLYQYQFSY